MGNIWTKISKLNENARLINEYQVIENLYVIVFVCNQYAPVVSD